jgi:hypothetical protein
MPGKPSACSEFERLLTIVHVAPKDFTLSSSALAEPNRHKRRDADTASLDEPKHRDKT